MVRGTCKDHANTYSVALMLGSIPVLVIYADREMASVWYLLSICKCFSLFGNFLLEKILAFSHNGMRASVRGEVKRQIVTSAHLRWHHRCQHNTKRHIMTTCNDCRYWWREYNASQNPCRRMPPVRFSQDSHHGTWPFVEADGYCGEHASRDPQPASRDEATSIIERLVNVIKILRRGDNVNDFALDAARAFLAAQPGDDK